MSNTETRTIPETARAEAEGWLARSPETVVTALARMIEDTIYLSMKAEWEMEDNFQITEGLSNIFPIPVLTDEETVEAARYFDLDPDFLDTTWGEAYDRAMELTEEN